jgi:hypothetical protein
MCFLLRTKYLRLRYYYCGSWTTKKRVAFEVEVEVELFILFSPRANTAFILTIGSYRLR